MSTIPYEVRNRFTGAVQFTAQIECADDALPSIKLGLAVQWAFKSGANLVCADLGGANLGGAYLRGADLSRADLSGADLSRANLGRHRLANGNSIASLGTPDGWPAFTYCTDRDGQRVWVGCQDKTIAEGRAYWANKQDRREVYACLDYAEAIGRARGWAAQKAEAA